MSGPVVKWMAVTTMCVCLSAGGSGQEPQAPKKDAGSGDCLHLMRFLDRDRDRQVDLNELASGQELASILLMLSGSDHDRDADGSLDLAELEAAVVEARKALAEVESEDQEQARETLARAVPLSAVLDRLATDEGYADEIASLREAIEDLDNDEAVVTCVTRYPARYPRLLPLIRTWGRHYPVRPELRRHFRRGPYRLPAHAKPGKPPKPGKQIGRPGPKPKPKPRPPKP